MKGISPLIATVILIALTMAIAGIMAAFATQITSGRIADSQAKADCLGTIDLSSINFANTTISVKVTNQNDKENLTGLMSDVEYGDPQKSKGHSNIQMKDYNFSDPLKPSTGDWFIYNTGDATTPKSIFIFATSCGREFGIRLFL